MSGQNEGPGLFDEHPTHTRSNSSKDTSPPRRDRPSRPQTQRERVVAMLRDAEAVCATTFFDSYIVRAAAVVHKLRKAGYSIATRPCTRPWHAHSTRQVEYVLEAMPFDPTAGPDDR